MFEAFVSACVGVKEEGCVRCLVGRVFYRLWHLFVSSARRVSGGPGDYYCLVEAAHASRFQVEYRDDRRITQRVCFQGGNGVPFNNVSSGFFHFFLDVVSTCESAIGFFYFPVFCYALSF